MNRYINFRFLFIGVLLLCITLEVYAKDAVLTIDMVENLIKVPLCRQSTGHTCGVASLQSVLYYYYSQDPQLRWVREDNLAKELKTTDDGTRYGNIVETAEAKGLKAEAHLKMTLDDLQRILDKKRPVICVIQAWADDTRNYKNDRDDGHYVVAIGYDYKNIYFMDPATLGDYTYIPIKEFLDRWHDTDVDGTKVIGLGIELWKDTKPTYDYRIIRKLE